ncbi:ESX-4 secretion system protein EccC4 [Corynascus novoguineensis]|uniref:ESX-4 secretion system protein EccC4 n=1 Tax=Corynascus novoguineensis TaxID=1126955 RepID=A0AAN7HKA2_9PEZI|nr:ESX-4 secretion system protein EccC4 [Corynascus novoguineensis]
MKRLLRMLVSIFHRRGRYRRRYTPDDYTALFSESESLIQDASANDHHDYDDATTLYTNDDIEETRPRQDVASKVAYLLWRAENNDGALQIDVSKATGGRQWNCKMAEDCLDNIIEYVGQGRDGMGFAMRQALDKVTDIADEEFKFPRNHPQSVYGFVVIVSAGVLAELQGAWVLQLLGFGDFTEEEKMTGTRQANTREPEMSLFAARWIVEYKGYIPDGSISSYLCRIQSLKRAEMYHKVER